MHSVAIEPANLERFSWADLFGPTRAALPIEVEIGTGKAAFLLRRARAEPERNFLGIEWANEFYKFAVDRVQRWGVTNVRMLRTDASRLIRETCPRNSLAALHVFHPDPWPKRRHHRRRLFQPAFVDAAASCLVTGGRLAVQTDHAEYFEQIRALLTNHPQLRETPFDDPRFGTESTGLATNFEIKYLREGRKMYRIAVVKVGKVE